MYVTSAVKSWLTEAPAAVQRGGRLTFLVETTGDRGAPPAPRLRCTRTNVPPMRSGRRDDAGRRRCRGIGPVDAAPRTAARAVAGCGSLTTTTRGLWWAPRPLPASRASGDRRSCRACAPDEREAVRTACRPMAAIKEGGAGGASCVVVGERRSAGRANDAGVAQRGRDGDARHQPREQVAARRHGRRAVGGAGGGGAVKSMVDTVVGSANRPPTARQQAAVAGA